MMRWRIVKNDMQWQGVLGAMPNIVVNGSNNTVIIDGLLKDERLKGLPNASCIARILVGQEL